MTDDELKALKKAIKDVKKLKFSIQSEKKNKKISKAA